MKFLDGEIVYFLNNRMREMTPSAQNLYVTSENTELTLDKLLNLQLIENFEIKFIS